MPKEEKHIGFDDAVSDEICDRVDERRQKYREIDFDALDDIYLDEVLTDIGASQEKMKNRWSMPYESYSGDTPKLKVSGQQWFHFEAQTGGGPPQLVAFWLANGRSGPYTKHYDPRDMAAAAKWMAEKYGCWVDYSVTVEKAEALGAAFQKFFGDEEVSDE